MPFNQNMTDELNLILKYPSSSLMQGLKIHHDADPAIIAAAQRLYNKGIVSQPDGGYLTNLGYDLCEHAKVIQSALTHT
ncbi:MAG: TIGR02647 family protein [Glaciecola sp.]